MTVWFVVLISRLPVPLDWGRKQSVDFVRWWENESDPALNSNAYQVAQELIQKHFPGPWLRPL